MVYRGTVGDPTLKKYNLDGESPHMVKLGVVGEYRSTIISFTEDPMPMAMNHNAIDMFIHFYFFKFFRENSLPLPSSNLRVWLNMIIPLMIFR